MSKSYCFECGHANAHTSVVPTKCSSCGESLTEPTSVAAARPVIRKKRKPLIMPSAEASDEGRRGRPAPRQLPPRSTRRRREPVYDDDYDDEDEEYEGHDLNFNRNVLTAGLKIDTINPLLGGTLRDHVGTNERVPIAPKHLPEGHTKKVVSAVMDQMQNGKESSTVG